MSKPKPKPKSASKRWSVFFKHPFVRKNKPMLHTIEWLFILLAFFAIGLPIIYFQSAESFTGGGMLKYVGNLNSQALSVEEINQFVGETVSEPVADVSGWDTYRNQWFGFEIKHPDSWTNMSFRSPAAKNARNEITYKFRKDSSRENDPYIGFDVVVYATKKAASPDSTNDMQKIENAPEDMGSCQFLKEMTFGDENNKFQKVSVQKDDACYEPTYFFSTTKDNYLYNIIPVAKEGADIPANPEQDVNKNFPEYKQVVASFKSIPISRPLTIPKTTISKPKINAHRPVAAKVVSGRLICPFKNDRPSHSKTKGHHMDEDCCMDPDESPNPWCTY